MSLHKSNDTTTVQIKKRYISDGTAQKQVKKKYKSDGTSLDLVYSSEEVLFPDQYSSWEKGSVKNGGGADVSSSMLHIYSSSNTSDGAIGSARFKTMLDVTKYKKITARIRYKTPQYETWGNAKFGLSASNWLSCWYGSNEGVVDSSPWTIKKNLPQTSLNWKEETVTLDVTSISGTYYLIFACFGGLQGAEMNVYSVILE